MANLDLSDIVRETLIRLVYRQKQVSELSNKDLARLLRTWVRVLYPPYSLIYLESADRLESVGKSPISETDKDLSSRLYGSVADRDIDSYVWIVVCEVASRIYPPAFDEDEE